RLYSKSKGTGYTAYFLELTSQSWHPEKTFPPVWRHWLTLLVPNRRTKDSALLTLTSGLSSPEKPMSEIPLSLVSISASTNSIVAILEGFPIDPTGYYETPSNKVELKDIDFFIWSLRQYYDTNDPSWIVLLPMVKSVVSAINAIQEFILKDLKSEIPVKEFVLCAEAPFFACWLVPAVDERVIGIAGINNFVYNIEVLIKNYLINEISLPSLFEEVDNKGLLQHFETQEGERLLNIIDPYNYRQFLKIPKLIVSYNGPSHSNFSFLAEEVASEIPDPIHWTLFPHLSLSREPVFLSQNLNVLSSKTPVAPKIYDFRDTLHVFYHRVINRKELPSILWNITPEGKCSAKISEEVVEARAWFCIKGSKNELIHDQSSWQMILMTEIAEGTYEANLNLPKENYKAVFIEVVFPSLSGTNFPITSPIHIIPPQNSES
ncbi:MAG: PhoPQ-activated pathogenicity-related family protein, partial [Candidatus Hydrogenedentes bacterium]|nr:PhoPQ-activated pathogenicity-related family protein [Candidatus Hydrogenedentota bacterium]